MMIRDITLGQFIREFMDTPNWTQGVKDHGHAAFIVSIFVVKRFHRFLH